MLIIAVAVVTMTPLGILLLVKPLLVLLYPQHPDPMLVDDHVMTSLVMEHRRMRNLGMAGRRK